MKCMYLSTQIRVRLQPILSNDGLCRDITRVPWLIWLTHHVLALSIYTHANSYLSQDNKGGSLKKSSTEPGMERHVWKQSIVSKGNHQLPITFYRCKTFPPQRSTSGSVRHAHGPVRQASKHPCGLTISFYRLHRRCTNCPLFELIEIPLTIHIRE